MQFKKLYLTLLVTTALTACGTTSTERELLKADPFVPPQQGDGGIEVARTNVVGRAGVQQDADCAAVALGVSVGSLQGEEQYLFDASGEPCPVPGTLFDGRTAVDSRATAVDTNIRFVDTMGYTPPRTGVEGGAAVPVLVVPPSKKLNAQYPPEMAGDDGVTTVMLAYPQEQAPQPVPQAVSRPPVDLEAKIARMMELEQRQAEKAARTRVLTESERLLADIRDLERMSETQLIEAHQERIEGLTAQLREQERALAVKERHQADIQARIIQAEQQQAAQHQFMRQEQTRLAEEREQLQLRLAQMSAANERLANRQQQREEVLLQQISQLSANLEAAEIAAEQGRHELVVEAAQRIAEAEQLAQAARTAQQQAQQREALRLKVEGETMMERALAMNEGRQIFVEGLSDQLAMESSETLAPLPLDTIPLFIEAVDTPLRDIFERVFKQAENMAGTWRHRFELDAQNEEILDELWTVTAETTFGEFMASIAAQVQAEHQVQLRYRQFDTARLFVISDR